MLFSNKRHPELGPDEVWITNTDLEGFSKIKWKTKRMGDLAYDLYGKIINGYNGSKVLPVFVKKSEIMLKKPQLLKELGI